MIALGKCVALGFLGVLCLASVVPPADPGGECVAMQSLPPGGYPQLVCATVNCGEVYPCTMFTGEYGGGYWVSCVCGGQLAPCAGAWQWTFPTPMRICIQDDCPVLMECVVQDLTPLWTPVCDCVYPDIG